MNKYMYYFWQGILERVFILSSILLMRLMARRCYRGIVDELENDAVLAVDDLMMVEVVMRRKVGGN